MLGSTTASTVTVAPISIGLLGAPINFNPVTSIVSTALTVQVAVTPFAPATVITAVPRLFASTTPSAFTEATSGLSDVKVTDLSVASLGCTVTVRFAVVPTLSNTSSGFTVILVTLITSLLAASRYALTALSTSSCVAATSSITVITSCTANIYVS